MTTIERNEVPATAPKKEVAGINYVVIALVVLAFAAFLAYQVFGCTGCYNHDVY